MSEKVILMYHSISGENQDAVAGSFPISMERFIYQINSFIEKGWRPEFISKLHDKIDENDRCVYICSDDGTVDWSRNALPWCEEQKIPTHTGLITGPWENEPIYPLAHIIQVKLAVNSKGELEKLAQKLATNLDSEQLAYVEKLYHYETEWHRRIIKGTFNLIFDQDEAYEALGELSSIEKKELAKRFESPENYKSFQYAELGVHTRSHWALDQETQKYVDEEIQTCWDVLVDNRLEPTAYYTSPMQPRYGASINDLIEPLQKLNYKGILTSTPGQWDSESFVIPRIDGQKVEEFLNIPHFDKTVANV